MTLRIDRYQVERLIGQGAMGKVYLANDPKLGRQVAVKVLATGTADEQVRQRFRLEARAIAALKHPNIVELYDYSGEDAPDLFLVMEYVPGASLDAWQRQHGNMSEATALCVGHELALALSHAHEHQVVHRDLKPENVLLTNGRVVLTDFGVVKAVAANPAIGVAKPRTRTQILGTPGFMAPEQFSGRQIDARTDVFSLGAVLYELCTGKLPYAGQTVDAIYENLQKGRLIDPREHVRLLSPGFSELVHKCLEVKPKDRFESAAAVRARLLALLASHGVTEVRQELNLYEKSPASYAVEQRQRSVEVLLRDLKVALKDRDEDMALSIMKWVQNVAPLDQRMLDVTGVTFIKERPVVHASAKKPRRWAWVLTGVGIGLAVGLVVSVAVDLRQALPPGFWRGAQAFADWWHPKRR